MKIYNCPICCCDFEFELSYPTFRLLCKDCESECRDINGDEPQFDSWKDEGENIVFVDGIKCWRRYKFGGYITVTYDSWEKAWQNLQSTYIDNQDGKVK